jgi:hypothetical protein
MNRVTSPQDAAAARNYIDLLRQNKFAQIEKDMDPSLQYLNLRDVLTNMAALLPAQQPVSVKVVGMNTIRESNSSTINATLEYEFPGRWLLANVATKKKDGVVTIVGFHVYQIPDSLEHQNQFTLVGKSFDQYATLFVGTLEVVLSLCAFVVCLRTKMAKGKWLWSIICLLGVGQFGVDWTTGRSSWTALAIHLPPAGAAAPLYGAWVIYVSVPLGAIVFFGLLDWGYW